MKLKIKEVDQLAQITIVRSGHGFVWTIEIGSKSPLGYRTKALPVLQSDAAPGKGNSHNDVTFGRFPLVK